MNRGFLFFIYLFSIFSNGPDYSRVGQAGLNVAARLQSLGVSNLIIDKNERIGDNWRNRYRVSLDPLQQLAWVSAKDVSSIDSGYSRSCRIHPHGVPTIPEELAPVHPERQTWRLVRSVRQYHGAQRVAQDHY